MRMKRNVVMKSVAMYYAKAAVFMIASYGLLLLIYGKTKLSFFEWVLILLAAFTIAYIPVLIRLLRRKEM